MRSHKAERLRCGPQLGEGFADYNTTHLIIRRKLEPLIMSLLTQSHQVVYLPLHRSDPFGLSVHGSCQVVYDLTRRQSKRQVIHLLTRQSHLPAAKSKRRDEYMESKQLTFLSSAS